MPRTGLICLFALMLWPSLAAAQLAVPGRGSDAYRTDERARRMRVAFPPHDRLWLGGGYGFGTEPSGEFELGLAISLDVDFPDEEIWWQLRHQIAVMRYQPRRTASFHVTFVEGDYLRHDTSSTILIPRGKRDIRLPAPFDIAVLWTLGALDIDPSDGVAHADVAELALLADFVRDPDYRHRFALGTCGQYAATREDARWRHHVVPFAGMTALYGWEAANGRFRLTLRPTLEYGASILVSEPVEWSWTARGRASVEWVALAVNDLPVSLTADGGVDHALGGATEWTAGLGARLALPFGM